MTPVVSQHCQVRISSIQYTANFSITTEDDFVGIGYLPGDLDKYSFKETGQYYQETIASVLNNMISKYFTVELTESGQLKYTPTDNDSTIEIHEATHRAKLLMGLYHFEFPIFIKPGEVLYAASPLTCYGNMLYLESNLPSPVGVRSNDKNKEEYKSIVYKGSDFIYPGIPVNSRTPGPVIVTKTENLTDLEFRLVDFMMQPVILHSPLTITMEVFYGLQPMPMLPIS